MIPRGLSLLVLLLASCSGSNESTPDMAAVDVALPDLAAPDKALPAPTGVTLTLDKTVTLASTTSKHLAFPSVTALPKGAGFLVTYREGSSHVDSTGRLMKQRGSADGAIWQAAEVLLDTPGVDDRDPSLVTLTSGEILVSYFQYAATALTDGTLILHQVFLSRSSDGGKTFSKPVQLTPGSMDATGAKQDTNGLWVDSAGKGITVKACSSPVVQVGAELLLPLYGGPTLNLAKLDSHPRSRISLLVSGDGGKSWSERQVAPGKSTGTWLQEPSLVVSSPGRWLLHARTAKGSSPSGAGYQAQAVSTDQGKTWSDFADLKTIGHAPDLLRLSRGPLLSAVRGLDASYGKADVSIISSVDEGKTWGSPLVVEACGSSECAYPSLRELPGDRLLVVYYGPGGKSIKAGIYKLSYP